MIVALPKLDRRRLAADFCDAVRAELSPDQIAKVLATEIVGDCDPLADYVDTGELLVGAITRQFRFHSTVFDLSFHYLQ